ncbi:hypothetical protein I5487_02930 [Citrobacter freundii]|nr:hypothetical protein [Citrobacter freundii]
MSTSNPIPERLKEARIKAGISQRALGILVGFDPASASSRMNHYEKMTPEERIQLIEKLKNQS